MGLIQPRLKHRQAIPYGGGFTLLLNEKGMVGSGTNFEMLVANIRTYRSANGIPWGLGTEDEIELEVCRRYPDACKETSDLAPNLDSGMTLADLIRGTRALFALKMSGGKLVSQDEATRRAAICADCRWNRKVSKPCSSLCGELKDIVLDLVGGASTPSDPSLDSCAVCKCYNAAQVWVPLEILDKTVTETMRGQFQTAKQQFGCWHVLS